MTQRIRRLWVWVYESAEIAALGEFGIDDYVEWSCRVPGSASIEPPVDAKPEGVVDEGGKLQKAFDDKYGKGTVVVTSALAKATSPGL